VAQHYPQEGTSSRFQRVGESAEQGKVLLTKSWRRYLIQSLASSAIARSMPSRHSSSWRGCYRTLKCPDIQSKSAAVVAPRGRADDFSWPRRDISGTADTEALPDPVPPKGAAPNSGADDGKKNTDKTAPTKSSEANRATQSSPAPHVTTARPRHRIDQ
jgi:hypothetical protein